MQKTILDFTDKIYSMLTTKERDRYHYYAEKAQSASDPRSRKMWQKEAEYVLDHKKRDSKYEVKQ